jgi:hypothetical protein
VPCRCTARTFDKVAGPAIMLLSWDFSVHRSASFWRCRSASAGTETEQAIPTCNRRSMSPTDHGGALDPDLRRHGTSSREESGIMHAFGRLPGPGTGTRTQVSGRFPSRPPSVALGQGASGKLLRISDDDCGAVDGAGSQWSAVLGCRNGGLDRWWRSGGRGNGDRRAHRRGAAGGVRCSCWFGG